jgi:hypothetical protein
MAEPLGKQDVQMVTGGRGDCQPHDVACGRYLMVGGNGTSHRMRSASHGLWILRAVGWQELPWAAAINDRLPLSDGAA